jgi:hypothetical protein
MSPTNLPVKDPLERVPLTFDFAAEMDAADSLSTIAVVVEALVAGADASPNAVLDGAPIIAGRLAVQWLQAGVTGASYRLRATGTSAQGRVLVLRAVLPVRTVLA